jgi:hypothetical protein
MCEDAANKYGLKVIGGGVDRRMIRRRSPVGARELLDLDTRMRTAFRLYAVAPNGNVVSRSVQEVLEGRQRPWSCLGRRAIEMQEAGTPSENFDRLLDELKAWHDQHFNRRPAA